MDREAQGLASSRRMTVPEAWSVDPTRNKGTKERCWEVQEPFWWEEVDWRTCQ